MSDDDRKFASGVTALIERSTPGQRLILARHALASLTTEDRATLLAPPAPEPVHRGRPIDFERGSFYRAGVSP